MDRFFHCTHMNTGSTKQMEEICRQQSCSHWRGNSISFMETCAISIQSCWSNLKRKWTYNTVNIHTMVERTTMAFTGAIQLAYNRYQHSNRQPGNQKLAYCLYTTSRRHHTKIFQLNRFTRVIGYCKRFIRNCINPKAKRQPTILFTQDLDQALTCCVKMAQQNSYAQKWQDLMEAQEVATSSFLKTLHRFIDKEGLHRVWGWLQQSTLPHQTMHQMILPSNHHFTK